MANKTVPAPVPAPAMAKGFIGSWPLPEQFGKQLSPAIVATAADWNPQSPGLVYPKIISELGQTEGDQFFYFGTYVKDLRDGTQGYLTNPYSQTGPSPHFVSGQAQSGDWQEEPATFAVAVPPGAGTAPTNQQLASQIITLAQQIK